MVAQLKLPPPLLKATASSVRDTLPLKGCYLQRPQAGLPGGFRGHCPAPVLAEVVASDGR